MARRTGVGTRTAAVATGGMGVLYLHRLLTEPGGSAYVAVLTGFVALVALLTAVKMWRDGCFESRLVALLVAVGTIAAQLLVVTVGLPGTGGGAWTLGATVLLSLAVAVPLLMLTGARAVCGLTRPRTSYDR